MELEENQQISNIKVVAKIKTNEKLGKWIIQERKKNRLFGYIEKESGVIQI